MLRPWLRRLGYADVSRLSRLDWNYVRPLGRPRRSAQLGHGGCIGASIDSVSTPYRAVNSLPGAGSIPDEYITANNTWGPLSRRVVRQADQLTMGWKKALPRFPFDMVSQSSLRFMTGSYEFAAIPFAYELVQRMIHGALDFSHLEAPSGRSKNYMPGSVRMDIGVAHLCGIRVLLET